MTTNEFWLSALANCVGTIAAALIVFLLIDRWIKRLLDRRDAVEAKREARSNELLAEMRELVLTPSGEKDRWMKVFNEAVDALDRDQLTRAQKGELVVLLENYLHSTPDTVNSHPDAEVQLRVSSSEND